MFIFRERKQSVWRGDLAGEWYGNKKAASPVALSQDLRPGSPD